jgi:NTE family protein
MSNASVKDAVDQFRENKNGQVVLVLQGGGALGAYQVGVYQALHEAGVEPDWIIGTSIGAINAALIAGNNPESRLARLEEFWRRVRSPRAALVPHLAGVSEAWSSWSTLISGISGFFKPNPWAFWSMHFPWG